ncbi:MAG: hypothetical protein OXG13_07565 [Gemmatimonadaceae bacterium]|nr:hypothetical protein [Gemmatimonadaceae bacterium]
MSDDALGRLIGRQLEDIDVLLDRSSQRLRNYLAFRHRSRHSSVNSLAWDPMAHLVADLPQTWNTVRAEILKFLQGQQSSADPE